MAKQDGSMFGLVVCGVLGVLLYNYLSPTDSAAADSSSAAGIQSDEAAAAMTQDAGGDPTLAAPGRGQLPGRPIFLGPPIWAGEDDKPDPSGGGTEAVAGDFLEDTKPRPYAGGVDPFGSPRFDMFEL